MEEKIILVWLSDLGHSISVKVSAQEAWHLEYIIAKAGYQWREFDAEEIDRIAKELIEASQC